MEHERDWGAILARVDELPTEEDEMHQGIVSIMQEVVADTPLGVEIVLKKIAERTGLTLTSLRSQMSAMRRKWQEENPEKPKKIDASAKMTKIVNDRESSSRKEDLLAVVSNDIRASIVDQFGDFAGDAWVHYEDGDRRRFFSAHSTAFEDFVRTQAHDSVGKPVEAWVKQITRLIASESRRAGMRELGVRWTVDDEGRWLYQLDENHILVVDDQGFEICDTEPVFRHYTEQKPLSVNLDAELEDLDLLDAFFNFRDRNEYQLFKAILPAFLVPDISKPIMMFTGPPGSAKSTACRLIKILLDPVSGMEYGSEFTTKTDQLFVMCLRNQAVIFDNVQDPTPSQQDTMSRLATGLNINARKLYTNNEMVSATFRRIQLVNGIQFTNLQADLIDRTLMWELDRVPDEDRAFEAELYARFEKVAPRIRGAMFKALWQMRSQKVERSPDVRLVDFAQYAIRSGVVHGYEEDLLHDLFSEKVNLQKTESLDASMVAVVLLSWLEDREGWDGTPTDLYEALTKYINGQGQERIGSIVPAKDWYGAPNKMTKDLRLIAHNLKFRGWEFSEERKNSARRLSFRPYVLPSLSDPVRDAKRFDEVREQIRVLARTAVKVEDVYAVTGVVGKRVVASLLEKGDLVEIRAGEVMWVGA